jgi:hypothetical protein
VWTLPQSDPPRRSRPISPAAALGRAPPRCSGLARAVAVAAPGAGGHLAAADRRCGPPQGVRALEYRRRATRQWKLCRPTIPSRSSSISTAITASSCAISSQANIRYRSQPVQRGRVDIGLTPQTNPVLPTTHSGASSQQGRRRRPRGSAERSSRPAAAGRLLWGWDRRPQCVTIVTGGLHSDGPLLVTVRSRNE